jgi:uncharacterized protein VirK/YbjX
LALPPEKVRELHGQFLAGLGIRAAARAVGVHRDTAMRYRRAWVHERLQAAYDELWNGNDEACDAICATLPTKDVRAMLDEWLDDQFRESDDERSGWYHRA